MTEFFPAGQLLNIYYETADNWLRRHDMGLRIRGDQGRYDRAASLPHPERR
jgi:triphosphatase